MEPVSKTAYYCCGVRMQDADSKAPIVGDGYARRLMGQDGLSYWQHFKKFKRPNASNLARCYLIDNHIKTALAANKNTKVFLIGAGLDSRAFRLAGGQWFEVDEVAMINYKNQILPESECPNNLKRIAIDFEKDTLQETLKPYADSGPVFVIVEGVILYLTDEQLKTMLEALVVLFPEHYLLCDLLKGNLFKLSSRGLHKKLVELGTTFQDISNNPTRIFSETGYQKESMVSTVKTANDLGLLNFPKFVINGLLSNLMMGYSVYKFHYRALK